jgi:hypothetical protein
MSIPLFLLLILMAAAIDDLDTALLLAACDGNDGNTAMLLAACDGNDGNATMTLAAHDGDDGPFVIWNGILITLSSTSSPPQHKLPLTTCFISDPSYLPTSSMLTNCVTSFGGPAITQEK